MDDIKIVLTIVIGVVVVIAFPVGCTMHRQQIIANAIEKGADPIVAKCAIEGEVDSTRQSGMCIAKAFEKFIQR